MRGHFAMGLAVGLAIGAAPLAAKSILGARGEFRALFSNLAYDPAKACSKPWRPTSAERSARAAYLIEAKAYVGCLKSASEADEVYAQEVVADGFEESVDKFVREVERGY